MCGEVATTQDGFERGIVDKSGGISFLQELVDDRWIWKAYTE
jgi:hypothetical protein